MSKPEWSNKIVNSSGNHHRVRFAARCAVF
jgi:hypothetical protein